MSKITKVFYDKFWENKSYQNLFLLSKEEFLETFLFEFEGVKKEFPLPRIIISNTLNDFEDDILETVINRNKTQHVFLDSSINERLNHFLPIFEDLFESKLKKPIDNFIKHIEKKGLLGLVRIIFMLADEDKREENIIKLLQEFKFINPNVNNFKELEENFKTVLIPKNNGKIFTENNINTFLEGVKLIKDIYINHYYKKLYSTNQILINSLNSEDDFASRIKLFHTLFEDEIIYASKEDALVECTNCKPGTYKGAIKLNIDPNKLSKLKCPVCNSELTYFVPYELDKEIFEIVKSKDGLLLNAYCDFLYRKKLNFKININYLDDIEVDCIFSDSNYTYIVECKMYKINTPKNRLNIKIKRDYRDLIKVAKRLIETDEFLNKNIKPILLVNIIDTEFIIEIERELKEGNNDVLYNSARILNIDLISKNN